MGTAQVQEILIRVSDYAGRVRERSIEAEVYGPWAVHTSTLRGGGHCGHTVTHIATGTAYAIGCDREQARALAIALIAVPDADTLETGEDAAMWHRANVAQLLTVNHENGIRFDPETRQQYGSEAAAAMDLTSPPGAAGAERDV